MKLKIEIDGANNIEYYLSVLSLGILESIDKGSITFDDAMNLLYFPGMIEKFEKIIPSLGEAIHLGTELEDVADIIPDRLKESIQQIKDINSNSICESKINPDSVRYRLDE